MIESICGFENVVSKSVRGIGDRVIRMKPLDELRVCLPSSQ